MRTSMGLTHFLELIFGGLTLIILLMGLFRALWHSRGRIDRARVADKWMKFTKRFLPRSAANENGSGKGTTTGIKQDGVVDGDDADVAKPFSDEGEDEGEAEDHMVSSVLIGLQSRFLYTIMEESKEDLGSDCGRSSRGDLSKRLSIMKSWSDLGSRPSCRLSESTPSTPPSKFKFLRDADDEFCRRLKLEDGSWSKIIGRRRERDILPQIILPTSSTVLPLESSPPY